jgi:hypothetical protein
MKHYIDPEMFRRRALFEATKDDGSDYLLPVPKDHHDSTQSGFPANAEQLPYSDAVAHTTDQSTRKGQAYGLDY